MHVPNSASPNDSRYSTLWFRAPAPSPRFAVNGAPEWTPRHSTELCVRLIMRVGEARERGEGRGLQADGLDVCQKTCVCEDGWGALA